MSKPEVTNETVTVDQRTLLEVVTASVAMP